jgi:hypothetical protein
MPRLALPEVTLCCVDTRSTEQAVYALRQCMAQAQFAKVLLLGNEEAMLPTPEPSEFIECIRIPPLRSIDDYSRFMLKELVNFVDTSHVLVVQWDGYIRDASQWRPEFLGHDYIGAPWHHKRRPVAVGNGGFSLRSRALLQALQQLPSLSTEPEDMAICVDHRDELAALGIRVAPVEVGFAFACEYGPWRDTFGFHGMHNFARVMDEPTLDDWLSAAPAHMLLSEHGRKLIKALIDVGRCGQALRVIRQRAQAKNWNADLVNLTARCGVRVLKQALTGR